MTPGQSRPINVFISYSWTTPEHEEWVLNLAKRLDEFDSIHVILDKWDLQSGNDVIAFMESMVKGDVLVDKVLIICDKKYVDRANNREKGVGTEAQIISTEIYKEVKQTKFIAVVREYNDEEEAYLPTFFGNRLYEDFSNDDRYEESFAKLLHVVTGHPYHVRPAKKGPLPSYITNPSVPHYKTTQIANSIDSILSTRPQQLDFKVKEFLDELVIVLGKNPIIITDTSAYVVGEQLYEEVQSLVPFREDFLNFFDKIIRSGYEFDIDLLINFYCRIHKFTYELITNGPQYDAYYDGRKYMLIELFLSFIGLCLKHNSYKYIEEILYTSYQLNRYNDWPEQPSKTFKNLYSYPQYLEEYYRNKELKNNRLISPIGSLLHDQVSPIITKSYLVAADLLCLLIAKMNDKGDWYPLTIPYIKFAQLDIFTRIKSAKYFERVKGVYDVQTVDEMKQKINILIEAYPYGLQFGHGMVFPIKAYLNPDTIAQER